MYFRCFSYLNVLIASAMVAVVLWAYAQCHRRVRGATLFSLLMLLGAVWSLCNALEMAGTGLPTKLFWANAQYLCYTTAPVVWLVLSPQHTDCAAWLTSRRIAWLGVEPLITIALVWTNAWHGLIQRNVSLDTAGPFRVIAKAYGPWFWVHALYSGLQCIGLDTATNGAIVFSASSAPHPQSMPWLKSSNRWQPRHSRHSVPPAVSFHPPLAISSRSSTSHAQTEPNNHSSAPLPSPESAANGFRIDPGILMAT